MRLNTLVTLGASAAFGIMAVVLARGWINDAIEDEFRDNTSAQSVFAQSPALGYPVVIAANDLAFGDELTAEALRVVNYPKDAIPLGAYSAIDEVLSDYTARTVVLSQMRLNEPVMDYKISGPGGKGSLSSRISEGYRAAAIRVDDVTGVAGFVVPGDLVDVIYSYEKGTRGDEIEIISRVLLQNIKVLGIDQNQNDQSSSAEIANTVTVEVTNEDAQRLHLALESGRLSLTLRSVGETIITSEKTLTSSNMFAASKPKAKRRIPRKVHKAKPAQTNSAAVTIIRGDQRDEVVVLREETELTLAGG